ncbi:MAG: hypothetical protein KJ058_07870 [Thermoanaerobaculia bacterium]|nr:hypothetical protein [Thermoanaerobaculia bacterium]
MSIQRCKFCDHAIRGGSGCDDPAEKLTDCCRLCEELHHLGEEARIGMRPMEDCPWERGRRDVVRVFGDPDYHSVGAMRCPWCAGWAAAEVELYLRLRGGAR